MKRRKPTKILRRKFKNGERGEKPEKKKEKIANKR